MTHLALVAPYRLNDLPTAWDGLPVAWSDPQPGLIITHLVFTCAGCGTVQGGHQTYVGVVAPPEGTTEELEREVRLPSGRSYVTYDTVPARPRARLFLDRCLACGHDQVYDAEREAVWDLDADDYRDGGSWEPGTEQGALF